MLSGVQRDFFRERSACEAKAVLLGEELCTLSGHCFARVSVAVLLVGGALLIASVVQMDACIFVSTHLQHPGMIEALTTSAVSAPGNASYTRDAVAVAKACLGHSEEENLDRNLTSVLGLTGTCFLRGSRTARVHVGNSGSK